MHLWPSKIDFRLRITAAQKALDKNLQKVVFDMDFDQGSHLNQHQAATKQDVNFTILNWEKYMAILTAHKLTHFLVYGALTYFYPMLGSLSLALFPVGP